MSNKDDSPAKVNLKDYNTYKYAELANKVFDPKSPGSTILAGKSLEKLADDLGVPLSARGLMRGTLEDPRWMKQAIDDHSPEYKRLLHSTTIGEYLKRENINTEPLGKNFGQFFDKEYGIIEGKIEDAKYVIRGIKEGIHKFPEGELEKKRNDIRKYGGIYLLLHSMEDHKFEDLKGKIAEKNYVESFDELAKNPEKYVNVNFEEYLKD